MNSDDRNLFKLANLVNGNKEGWPIVKNPEEYYDRLYKAFNGMPQMDYAKTERKAILAMSLGTFGGINVMYNPLLPPNTMMVSTDLYETMKKLTTHEVGDKK